MILVHCKINPTEIFLKKLLLSRDKCEFYLLIFCELVKIA